MQWFGQHLYSGDSVTTRSDGAGSPGDAVTFDAEGRVTPTTSTDDALVGVLTTPPSDSPNATAGVAFTGIGPVTHVASDVTAGDRLAPSGGTSGQLVADGSGPALALLDAGGGPRHDLPEDATVVRLP
jgi:hypothetical protein